MDILLAPTMVSDSVKVSFRGQGAVGGKQKSESKKSKFNSLLACCRLFAMLVVRKQLSYADSVLKDAVLLTVASRTQHFTIIVLLLLSGATTVGAALALLQALQSPSTSQLLLCGYDVAVVCVQWTCTALRYGKGVRYLAISACLIGCSVTAAASQQMSPSICLL